ncbi:MAG: YciE/YciF ferroxidase family protein [Phycisphaerae bacterium]
MATDNLNDLVVTHLQDAYAMEQNVLKMLDNMISTTDDLQMKQTLEHHRAQTVEHGNRVEQRLRDMNQSTSMTKNAGAMMTAWMKMIPDMMRDEKATKNLRDGYVTEHLEIAGYQLLERIADRAGDSQTADVARRNRQDEESMANRLASFWGRAVDLDLAKMGIEQDASGTPTGAYGRRADAAEHGSTWTGSSTDADMGMGFHSDRAATNTGYDQVQGNVPTEANVDLRTKTPNTRNP